MAVLRRLLALLILLSATAVAQAQAVSEPLPASTPPAAPAAPAAADRRVPIPALESAVIDLTGTLSTQQRAGIAATIDAYEARSHGQLQVLMLPSTQPESIEQYALRAFNTWKLGRKDIDDGLLVVVAKDDRRARIEVGYGLEAAIPDITAGRVIDDYMLPGFKRDDYAGGIADGVRALIGLAEGQPLPEPEVLEFHGWYRLLAALVPALLAGLAGASRTVSWRVAIIAAALGAVLCPLLAGSGVAASLAIAALATLAGVPLGLGLVKSFAVRVAAAAFVGVLLLAWVLAGLLARPFALMFLASFAAVFGGGTALFFLWLALREMHDAWRRHRIVFWTRIALWLVLLGFLAWHLLFRNLLGNLHNGGIAFAALGGILMLIVFLVGSGAAGGAGAGSRGDSGSGGGRSDGGRSGGGGSSGGAGASRSW
ncbi:TPM domain-containing protein [Luteimonas aquatica]|uniref:TPM domain-containing protein n=1 Tax=Luteimonas aquatica TaxID=450364 RepID=UPI001F57EE7A|nr:TPM domain-containing protein [Luteimonas aquatica]